MYFKDQRRALIKFLLVCVLVIGIIIIIGSNINKRETNDGLCETCGGNLEQEPYSKEYHLEYCYNCGESKGKLKMHNWQEVEDWSTLCENANPPQYCSICNAYDTNHEINIVKNVGTTTHLGVCNKCGEEFTQLHEYENEQCFCGSIESFHKCKWEGEPYRYEGLTENKHVAWYKCKGESCTKEKCEEEVHYGAMHEDGICQGCGYQYQEHGKTMKKPTYKKTDTTHTVIYRCKESRCTETYEGTTENHSIKDNKWISKGDGTHYGTCEKCGYSDVVGVCEYINGVCKYCNEQQYLYTEECQHVYEKKYDQISHWEECIRLGCKEEKINSREEHTNGTNSDCMKCSYIANNNESNNFLNDNTNNDKTVSTRDTDNKSNNKGNSVIFIIIIMILIILIIVGFVKMKEYRDV